MGSTPGLERGGGGLHGEWQDRSYISTAVALGARSAWRLFGMLYGRARHRGTRERRNRAAAAAAIVHATGRGRQQSLAG